MSAELIQVGQNSHFDHVRLIEIDSEDGAVILGKVNKNNGVFIPPNLKEVADKYEQPEDVKEVLEHAQHPVKNDYQFERFRYHDFDPKLF